MTNETRIVLMVKLFMKKFDEKTWNKKQKELFEIRLFLNNSYEYIYEQQNKKIIMIGDNVIQISKGLVFQTFISYFEDITKSIDAFRGFTRIDELYPGYRRKGKEIDEIKALKIFEKQGSAYFNAKNSLEFLANAQHYGLPTRLIDFTKNPYIALFFSMYSDLDNKSDYYYIACVRFDENLILEELPVFNSIAGINDNLYFCFGKEDQYCNFYKKIEEINNKLGSYYCKDDLDDNDIQIVTQRIEEVRATKDRNIKIGVSAFESRKNRRIMFVEPNYTNERIKNQQGLFMYPYDDNIDKHLEIMKNNITIIAIHKNYRKDIMNYLNKIGITEYRLMPDLSSICSEIIRELK